jgi:CHASE2 domain-containing sensor protein
MIALLDQRLSLIENARPSISWWFLLVTMFWLAVIFVIAGFSSSRNLLVFTATTLAALSVASSIYLSLELDTPLTGLITVSSTPLRDALLRITEPPLPPGVSGT